MTFGKKSNEKKTATPKTTTEAEPATTQAAPSAAKDSPAPASGGKRIVLELHPTRAYAVVTEGGGPSFKIAYHIRRSSGTEMVAPLKGGVSVPLSDWLAGKADIK